jgi:hypothetical protein
MKGFRHSLISCCKGRISACIVFGLFTVVTGFGLLVPGLSGCFGSSLKGFEQQALVFETAMHQKMASGDLAGIYDGADQRYRDVVTRQKSDALYSSIARKLGAPLDCKQGNTNFMVATSGTTIVSVCTTKFSKDATGVETFTWLKSGDHYKLLGYHINSNELIER